MGHRRALLSICAAVLLLSGCAANEETVPTEPSEIVITLPPPPTGDSAEPTLDPERAAESLTVVMSEAELYLLDHYPNLRTLDLSGSTCYAAIRQYIADHPQVDVTYNVSVGGTAISSRETAVRLERGSYDPALLAENLQYLPNLTAVSLPDVALNAAQLAALRERCPDTALIYDVTLLDRTYPSETTRLDLSELKNSQVEELLPALGMLTELTDVELSGSLSLESVAKLQDASPGAVFHYRFQVFGKTLSTTDKTVEFKGHSIGNSGEARLRQVLDILDSCERFVLDECGIDDEVLVQLREDYRDRTKIVWRVFYGDRFRFSALTDTDRIRLTSKYLTDDNCGALRYCEDVKYVDIGHNDYLTDLSFLGYMPKLEAVIASGCAATELVGLENCKNLTWLELAYCNKLQNIDCLAGCENLKYLNLSFTKVSSYIPLDSLPLERFMCLSPKAGATERKAFQTLHPSCLTIFYGYTNPYGYGWRYNDNGYTFFPYYKDVIREVFNYDYLDSILRQNEG